MTPDPVNLVHDAMRAVLVERPDSTTPVFVGLRLLAQAAVDALLGQAVRPTVSATTPLTEVDRGRMRLADDLSGPTVRGAILHRRLLLAEVDRLTADLAAAELERDENAARLYRATCSQREAGHVSVYLGGSRQQEVPTDGA